MGWPFITHTVLSLNMSPHRAKSIPEGQLKAMLKALLRVRAANPLLKEQLGSVSQSLPQAITEIKH